MVTAPNSSPRFGSDGLRPDLVIQLGREDGRCTDPGGVRLGDAHALRRWSVRAHAAPRASGTGRDQSVARRDEAGTCRDRHPGTCPARLRTGCACPPSRWMRVSRPVPNGVADDTAARASRPSQAASFSKLRHIERLHRPSRGRRPSAQVLVIPPRRRGGDCSVWSDRVKFRRGVIATPGDLVLVRRVRCRGRWCRSFAPPRASSRSACRVRGGIGRIRPRSPLMRQPISGSTAERPNPRFPASISSSSAQGSTTTPLPITESLPAPDDAGRQQAQLVGGRRRSPACGRHCAHPGTARRHRRGSESQSTILPLPSSPHWEPTTVTLPTG